MDPTNRPARILVVDDEPSILDVVSAALRLVGFEVVTATGGAEALREARSARFDLLVLDVMLPDLDGFGVVERLRSDGAAVPVLFLTARTGADDATRGLTLGGDDYVRKPFQLEELVARVRALLRRSGAIEPASEVLSFADVAVDLRQYVARRGGRVLELTPAEFRLLEVFVRNSGRVLTRPQIVDLVWEEPGAVDTTTIETVVSRLRRKLDAAGDAPLLVTRRGVGYGLVALGS